MEVRLAHEIAPPPYFPRRLERVRDDVELWRLLEDVNVARERGRTYELGNDEVTRLWSHTRTHAQVDIKLY